MNTKKIEPLYIHAAIIIAIIGLIYLLIQAIFILPVKERAKESEYKKISEFQIKNIAEAEKLYKLKMNVYTDDFDTLFTFLRSMKAFYNYDQIFNKSKEDKFIMDSLKFSPKTHQKYILLADTVITLDSVITKKGEFRGFEMGKKIIGKRLYIKCPDGYDSLIIH